MLCECSQSCTNLRYPTMPYHDFYQKIDRFVECRPPEINQHLLNHHCHLLSWILEHNSVLPFLAEPQLPHSSEAQLQVKDKAVVGTMVPVKIQVQVSDVLSHKSSRGSRDILTISAMNTYCCSGIGCFRLHTLQTNTPFTGQQYEKYKLLNLDSAPMCLHKLHTPNQNQYQPPRGASE